MNFLLHALLYTLASVFLAVSVTAVVVIAKRRRRVLLPAPLPARPPRTTVTAVEVRAIGQANRADSPRLAVRQASARRSR